MTTLQQIEEAEALKTLREMDAQEAPKQTELFGFKIERTDDPLTLYILHGKRGARYGLRKWRETDQVLRVVNLSQKVTMSQPSLKGNYTFIVVDGEIRSCTGSY